MGVQRGAGRARDRRLPRPGHLAVGHETDFTIADFVADLRAPTPSAAAELVAAEADEVREAVEGSAARAWPQSATACSRRDRPRATCATTPRSPASRTASRASPRRPTRRARRSSTRCARGSPARGTRSGPPPTSLAAADPRRRVLEDRARVSAAAARLATLARSGVETRRERLALLAGTLSSASPLDVLMRGYAIVRDERGRIVRSPADVAPGERVRIRVADGEFGATRDDEE